MSEPRSDRASRPHEVTRLLGELGRGEPLALEALLPLLYDELHELAASAMKRSPPWHTLQPTAVLNEAFARLLGQAPGQFESRDHFLAVAARAMRSVLVDHARRRGALKRATGGRRVELSDTVAGYEERGVDLLILEEALERLARFDPDLERVVELLYFAGLTAAEAARVLGCSSRTVERDWRAARAFLRAALEGDGAPL
ncbi:MAG: ECF-type sigma factor [Planctomycetota bacterium]